jgi:hypothetical protein
MKNNAPSSSSELSVFMDYFKLKDGFGNAHFPATIFFELISGSYQIESDVTINRGGYNNDGILTILSDQPLTTPVKFWAHFQEFVFIKGEGLQIKGVHQRPEIGAYEVFVTPIPNSTNSTQNK